MLARPFRFSFTSCFCAIFLLLLFRKIWIGHRALRIVHNCTRQSSFLSTMDQLIANEVLSSLPHEKPTLVMFLNSHYLQITFNWLCSTAQMNDVHSHLLIVTLDPIADQQILLHWPAIRRLNLNVPCLEEPFSYGDGHYQLFFLLRANLARILAQLGKPFWMIQQDTFWRLNLLELNLEEQMGEHAEILFDSTAGNGGKSQLIAGGYFFVRPTPGTVMFFTELTQGLATRYVPDNVWMSRLCATSHLANCSFLPFQTIANWQWLSVIGNGGDKHTPMPALIQFDGHTQLGDKLATMRAFGFHFLLPGGRNCDRAAVNSSQISLKSLATARQYSYSQWQFAFYQAVIEAFYGHWASEWLLHHLVYPYAHYFMLTI